MLPRVEEICEFLRVKLGGKRRFLNQLNKLESSADLWTSRQGKNVLVRPRRLYIVLKVTIIEIGWRGWGWGIGRRRRRWRWRRRRRRRRRRKRRRMRLRWRRGTIIRIILNIFVIL